MLMRLTYFPLRAIRQAATTVALLTVCVTPIEALIPDAHDGAAVVAVEAATGIMDSSDSYEKAPGDQSSGSGGDSLQMDHCSHAHSFVIVAPGSDFGEGPEPTPIDGVRSAPPSVVVQPHQRPPIV
jgi:uncharacterized protein involved in copper resistance